MSWSQVDLNIELNQVLTLKVAALLSLSLFLLPIEKKGISLATVVSGSASRMPFAFVLAHGPDLCICVYVCKAA